MTKTQTGVTKRKKKTPKPTKQKLHKQLHLKVIFPPGEKNVGQISYQKLSQPGEGLEKRQADLQEFEANLKKNLFKKKPS